MAAAGVIRVIGVESIGSPVPDARGGKIARFARALRHECGARWNPMSAARLRKAAS
jgi:hypothetical protein